MKYFWHYRPEDNFPPAPVVQVKDAPRSDRLCVACTQTSLSPAAQRALVREWCRVLPTLSDIRFLWLSSKVPQPLFEAACGMRFLEGLWIKWGGVTDITSLQCLDALRYFHLGSSTRLASIEPLSKLHNLKWLGLENLKLVRDLTPIAKLVELEGLTLEGSIWSTQRVKTLAPIARLRCLRYLSIANLRTDDHTLAPLFTLDTLETLICAKWWDETELAEIRRRNPGLAA